MQIKYRWYLLQAMSFHRLSAWIFLIHSFRSHFRFKADPYFRIMDVITSAHLSKAAFSFASSYSQFHYLVLWTLQGNQKGHPLTRNNYGSGMSFFRYLAVRKTTFFFFAICCPDSVVIVCFAGIPKTMITP